MGFRMLTNWRPRAGAPFCITDSARGRTASPPSGGRHWLLAAASTLAILGTASGLNQTAYGETPEQSHTRASAFTPAQILPRPVPPYQGTLGETPATSSPPRYAPMIAAPAGAPNVLLILTDDIGFGTYGAFGGPVPTPTFDALAAHGLRYNRFHTTALCAPTRAALLTGRNHHSVGNGMLPEGGVGYPGYNSVIPKSAATIAEVLRQNGYNTAMFGKNHNVPDWENNPAGPFSNWPTGMGFDYFFGFNSGLTNQWAPALVENTTSVEPPYDDPTYLLDRDLADHMINWLRVQNTQAPDKRFFAYYAPTSGHAPHDAPKEWIAKFKGKFDQGWDKLREETFARQKALGIIPADAQLTPRPPEIPAWDSLSPDAKAVAARLMEVFAAVNAYADYQIGRVIDELRKEGKLDNTMVIFIEGDNGGSAEGGLTGTTNQMASLNGVHDKVENMVGHLDQMGGPMADDHYPVGFAWALNTPFQWTKQVASHWGGTRNGMVISWPDKIKDQGKIRSQFGHVIDIAPTIYDAVGIPQPTEVNGVAQKPIEGVSLAPTFADAKAADRHKVQYFEMFGNRALYKDGWVAATHPARPPWIFAAGGYNANDFTWELYHVADDYSEAVNVADKYPDKLKQLQADFLIEARKHDVFPLDPNVGLRVQAYQRPYAFNGRQDFTFYPGPRLPDGAFPALKNASFTMTANVQIPKGGAEGMLVTQGGRFGGWGLAMYASKPAFIYNYWQREVIRLEADTPLAPGPHKIAVEFDYDGHGLGKGGTFILSADGKEIKRGRIENSIAGVLPPEGVSIGFDSGTPVAEDYKMPFRFTGTIDRLDVHLPVPAGMKPEGID